MPLHLPTGLGFFVKREEVLVWDVAEDLDEAFGLAELHDVAEQRVVAFLEAFHVAVFSCDDADLYALSHVPHLVRPGPAPLRVLLKVLPRLH